MFNDVFILYLSISWPHTARPGTQLAGADLCLVYPLRSQRQENINQCGAQWATRTF